MEINFLQILFQMINFGVIMFVLVKFLYQPISKVLEARSQKIQEGLNAAEKNIAARDQMEALLKEETAKARKEAVKIVAEAKKQAEVEAADIIARAKEQAKKAADNEKQAFESMLAESRLKAEKELKELVATTTAKVLSDGLSASDQRRIIESQLQTLKKIRFS